MHERDNCFGRKTIRAGKSQQHHRQRRHKMNEENFYKINPDDKIWWIDNPDTIGEWLFSFDKKKIFNMFEDYPWKLSKEEKAIFDKENPYWADFFKDRK